MKSLVSTIIEKLLFPIGDYILGTEVSKQLKIQRRYHHFSEAALIDLQEDKLFKVLEHAENTCEVYKGIEIDKINPVQSLKKFPVIGKGTITENPQQFLSSKFDFKKLLKYESSGSSGIRSVVYIDKKEQSTFRAILINWWEWNGYWLGKNVLQTGISPDRGLIKGIKDWVLCTTYINAFGISEAEVLKILKKQQKKKGVHFIGYASSLYVIAQIAKKHSLQIKFDKVISMGDKLFDHYKKLIEEVFNTEVVDAYGTNEGVMVGQTKDSPYFYIYTPSIYLEILDEFDHPLPDGILGRVVVTKLDGYAMPLIRYDTGDLAIKLPRSEYPIKRDYAFPLLEKVIGRNTDIIKTKDGKNLIVHTFTGIFEFFPEIKQFQVIQNEEDCIIIKYIKGVDFNKAVLDKIGVKFFERTGSLLSINWEEVEKIEASKSGKPQLIVNNLVNTSLSNIY